MLNLLGMLKASKRAKDTFIWILDQSHADSTGRSYSCTRYVMFQLIHRTPINPLLCIEFVASTWERKLLAEAMQGCLQPGAIETPTWLCHLNHVSNHVLRLFLSLLQPLLLLPFRLPISMVNIIEMGYKWIVNTQPKACTLTFCNNGRFWKSADSYGGYMRPWRWNFQPL